MIFRMLHLQNNQIGVIIPAGGSGQRFAGDKKKQFFLLKGKAILTWSLELFLSLSEVTQIVVALPQDEWEEFKTKKWDKRISFVVGGQSRSESVYRGFQHLKNCQAQDVILVHDAVRPLLSKDLVLRVVERTRIYGAVVPALKLTDTVKQVSRDLSVEKTLDRNQLYGAQTPQGFLCEKLKMAYEKLGFENARYTDESLLVETLGEKVFVVEGESENIKITTKFDLEMAEVILRMSGKA